MKNIRNFLLSVRELRRLSVAGGGYCFSVPAIRWLWRHRKEPNNRAKRRRMMREVQDGK